MKPRILMKSKVIFDRSHDVPVSSIGKETAKYSRKQGVSLLPKSRSMPAERPVSPERARLDSLVRGCRRMLFKISAIFPFDLFPDEIVIDECKVSIVFREFFFSDDIHSINIEMIRDVDVETGPFFAKLQIVPDGFPGHPLIVRYLRKRDAYKARSIIQGLMVAKRNNIDLEKVDEPNLVNKLELLGKTHVF